MGTIGNLMSGSGIEDLWETIYARGSIPHLISSHAYSRAMRANILTLQALIKILLNDTNLDCSELEQFMSHLMNTSKSKLNFQIKYDWYIYH